jgi:hypothetical protein
MQVLRLLSYIEGFCHIIALDEIVAGRGGSDGRFPNIEHVLPPGGTKIVCLFSLFTR